MGGGGPGGGWRPQSDFFCRNMRKSPPCMFWGRKKSFIKKIFYSISLIRLIPTFSVFWTSPPSSSRLSLYWYDKNFSAPTRQFIFLESKNVFPFQLFRINLTTEIILSARRSHCHISTPPPTLTHRRLLLTIHHPNPQERAGEVFKRNENYNFIFLWNFSFIPRDVTHRQTNLFLLRWKPGVVAFFSSHPRFRISGAREGVGCKSFFKTTLHLTFLRVGT